MRGAVVVLVFLLSGCIASGDAPVTSSADEAAAEQVQWAWGLDDCRFVIAVAAVSSAALAPYLPEGFDASLYPYLADAGADAELHFDVYVCAGGTSIDGSPLADVSYGSLYVPVEPPAALRLTGYDDYFVKLDFLVPYAPRRAAFVDAGFPAHDGSAAITAAGPLWQASLHLAGAGGFALTGPAVNEVPQNGVLPFMEYTPLASGGLARWHARLHDATFATGAGVLTVDEHLWAYGVVGPSVPVRFSAGSWNLDEAGVRHPFVWP